MRLSTRILAALATFALATAALAALGRDRQTDLGAARLVAQAGAAAQGELIALYLSGRVATERIDQTTDAWTGDLVSLATGEVATDAYVRCPSSSGGSDRRQGRIRPVLNRGAWTRTSIRAGAISGC